MISIRDYKDSDIDRLVLLANNAQISKYMTTNFPYPYTEADAKWWISTGCRNGLVKVIEYDGEFVGSVGAHPRSAEKERSAAIGYWVGEPYWGKGIAAAALVQLTSLVFSSTAIIRLEASIFSPNRASMRVAEKAGYKREAILEKAIFKNACFYDEYLYSKVSGQ